jgi:MFS family permease
VSTVDSDKATNDVGPWSPLHITIFRSLWISSSPTVVSLAQAAWTVPGFLLAMLAGAFADVVDRRRLIIVTQACSMMCAGVLGALELTDRLTIVELLVLTFLLSSAMTMSAPAFMALTPELVERDQLSAAIGLNSISSNIAQSLGPAVAGIVINRRSLHRGDGTNPANAPT